MTRIPFLDPDDYEPWAGLRSSGRRACSLRKTRESLGTKVPSGQLPGEGSTSSSSRFVAWVTKYLGQVSSSRGDVGAAVVEMAFIFGLLVMLLVGVVTSAIVFGQKNSIENAAREASRYAATLKPMDLVTVLNVARNAAQGDLDGSVEGQYICVAYLSEVSGWQKLEEVAGVPSGPSGTWCYDDGLSEKRVQIVTGRDSEINAALFSMDVTLNAKAIARYERNE